jgi:MYXO-CTERM domain-containing protein
MSHGRHRTAGQPLLVPLLVPLLALLGARPAVGAELVAGDLVQIYYNDDGTWNDTGAAAGFQAFIVGAWVEFSYWGYPWQRFAVEYQIGDESYEAWSGSGSGTNLLLTDERDDSTLTHAIATHVFEDDQVIITKVERWALDESLVVVSFGVTNKTDQEITNLRLLYAVDPDQDSASYGIYTTKNNVQNTGGGTASDYAESVGASSGVTLSFGACDEDNSALGHYAGWSNSDTDADTTLTDEAAATTDDAMALRWTSPDSLPALGSLGTSFLILASETEVGAEDLYTGGQDQCGTCDEDGDGHGGATCGGDDCDDAEPAVYPGAADAWYDGVDSDCAGDDDDDQDGDGDPAAEHGGGDCDDLDPAVASTAEEVWYDGIDQDCDGNDDDQDGDGTPLDADCDDTDPAVAEDCSGAGGDGGGETGQDTGFTPANEDVPFKACACSASPAPGAALPAAALVGLLALRRRRGSPGSDPHHHPRRVR